MVKKYCFVPGCANSSEAKQMVAVPFERERRKVWLEAVMVTRTYSATTKLFCCEDHFKLEEDLVNFVFYKEAGNRLRIKPNVVPRFNLNSPRMSRLDYSQLSESSKKRKREFHSMLSVDTSVKCQRESEECSTDTHNTEGHIRKKLDFRSLHNPDAGPSTPISTPTITEWSQLPFSDDLGVAGSSDGNECDYFLPQRSHYPQTTKPLPKKSSRKQILTPRLMDDEEPFGLSEMVMNDHQRRAIHDPQAGTLSSEYGTFVPPGTSEQYPHPHSSIDIASPPLAISLEDFPSQNPSIETEQIMFIQPPTRANLGQKQSRKRLRRDPSIDSSFSSRSSSIDSARLSKISSDTSVDLLNRVPLSTRDIEIGKLKVDPKFYLGLPLNHFHLIKHLANTIREPERNVMIVLKKIKTDDSHKRLGYDFCLSSSHISKIFIATLPKISERLVHFIKWPSREEIVTMMPIQFRSRFLHVQSIIDCFEVEIEKPSDPRRQSLTWSDYKKCNTMKYLISCTPLGLINFISGGFGGRMTDNAIVAKSGFLNVLPDSCTVLADRGFKQVEDMLREKNVSLVRPASVFKGQKLTKEQVRESRRIACTRVHVERVISRVREFAMLDPHSRVDNHLIHLLDHVVVVVCALVNLQDPILSI